MLAFAYSWPEAVATVGVCLCIAVVLVAALICGWRPWKPPWRQRGDD